MKKIFFCLFFISCKSNSIQPKTIETNCNPPTFQSLQMQPRDSVCYQLRFNK